MVVKAIRASEDNFRPFGKMVRLPDLELFSDEGWKCWITEEFCMNQPARLGIGFVEEDSPYEVSSMKRHLHTQKLMVCGEKAMVVALAASHPGHSAKGEDVRAFILEPGDFIVIDKGTWYDACHSITGRSFYYFLSLETDEESKYLPLEGSPVTIEACWERP